MSAELDWGKVLAAPPSAPRPATLRDRLLDIDDWVTLAVALTAAIAVAASIQSADWVESMPALPFVAAAGLLLGYLTTRVPLQSAAARAWIAFGTFLSAGAVTVIATTLSSIEQGNAWERWNAFRDRMAAWFDIVVNGGISDDHIPFVLLVVSLTWVVSFAMAWSIFVLRNAWLALVPLALVIIGNNAYRDIEFDAALVLFLFSGILLLGRVAFQRQQAVWSREDIEAPDFVGVRASWQTAWVVAALLGLAWLLPIDSTGDTLGGLWDDIAEPINERIFDNGRFFAGIRGDQAEAFRDFGDTLPLGGSIDLRNRVQLRAEVSEPVPFLRVAAYERYESGGWLTGERTTRAGFESDLPAPAEIADRAADT
ncbi:MAG TPA: hypothetical protein VNL92_01450, partial [Dehalococcoidia bacterium]|nr:hypothetical protein [Dehalococcoidia bacterium]